MPGIPHLNLSRRDVVVSAGLAAALGLNAHMAIFPQVLAQKTAYPAVGFHRYKVGEATCTAMYDGIWEKPHDPAFIRNASVDDVKAAMKAANLPEDFVSIPFTVLIVETGSKVVMCDAGTGGQVQPTAGRLMANMKAAGIDPGKIDTILISHFHPDHIFGLMEKETNAPVFPNADIVVSAAEYDWWTEAGRVEKLAEARKGLGNRIQTVFPTWKNIRRVATEEEVAPGIHMLNAPGHTPGHTVFHLSSGSKELMISNDIAYVPALAARNPGWHGVYDQDGPLAEATRRAMLDRVIADKMMICGYHFPFPGAGTISKDGNGYALVTNKV